MSEREKFEAWYGKNYSEFALKTWRESDTWYNNMDTELAWQSWQAAAASRDAEIEQLKKLLQARESDCYEYADEINELNAKVAMLDDALCTLSKLGNGNSVGNSVGNQIAHRARSISEKDVAKWAREQRAEVTKLQVQLVVLRRDMAEVLESGNEGDWQTGRRLAERSLFAYGQDVAKFLNSVKADALQELLDRYACLESDKFRWPYSDIKLTIKELRGEI